MRFKNIAFCLLATVCALTSCIKDDRSDCYQDNLLMLSYKGDGTTEIFNEKINRVEMYIFDSQNKCVEEKIVLTADEVKNRTVLLPQLKPGDYKIVLLGNTEHTGVSNVQSGDFSEITFADLDAIAQNSLIKGNDPLYYACEPYTVTREEKSQVIEFASSHYDVLIEAVGVPQAPDGQSPVFVVEGVMPQTDFNNRALGNGVTYQPDTDYNDELMKLSAAVNIMRHGGADGLQYHENVTIRMIAANGNELASVNLGDFLARYAEEFQIDCAKHEVRIPVCFEFKSGEVTVKLPDWYVEEIYPDYQ